MGIMLLLSALFVFINGFFVAAEFALVKSRPSRVEALAASGDRRAVRLKGILDELDLYLSACQLGVTIASLVLGYLAEPAFAALIQYVAIGAGWAVPDSTPLHAVSFGLALTIVTIVHMVLGEQAPKVWAIEAAEAAALRLSLVLTVFATTFKPLIVLVNFLSNRLVRLFGLQGGHGGPDADARELKLIIGASASAGNITMRQRIFAENIIDMVELEVRHVMLPRPEVAFIDRNAPIAESLERIRLLSHSRWPLCEGSLDDVRGMVLARDVLDYMLAHGTPPESFDPIARPPLLVPDTQPLSRFIHESQQTGSQSALVLDEHGTVVGMAFLEDALEEIVGPLFDERDGGAQGPGHFEQGGAFELDGALDLPEARDILGIDDDDAVDTIGGLVIARLGRLPRRGDQVEIGGYRATVLRVGQRRRVQRLRFEPLELAEPDSEPVSGV